MEQRIWCRNPSEEAELDAAWEKEPSGFAPRNPPTRAAMAPIQPPEPPGGPRAAAISPRGQSGLEGPKPGEPARWSPLPLRTLAPLDLEVGDPDLLADRPISCRAMAYAWRHLRRPLPDGPPDVLDVEATIAQAERQGFLLSSRFLHIVPQQLSSPSV